MATLESIRHPFKNEPVYSAIILAIGSAVGAKYGLDIPTDQILGFLGVAAVPAAAAIRSNVSSENKTPAKILEQKKIAAQKAEAVQLPIEALVESTVYDPLGNPIAPEVDTAVETTVLTGTSETSGPL